MSDENRTIEVTKHSAGKEDYPPASRPTSTSPIPGAVPPGTPGTDFFSVKPNIINLLYLASFVTGLTGIAGVVLCYIWSNEDAVQPWEKTHYQYHIRTFWFGLLGMAIGTVLMLVVIGFLVWIAVAVWMVVRCVMSLNNAQKAQPMPDPTTLLW